MTTEAETAAAQTDVRRRHGLYAEGGGEARWALAAGPSYVPRDTLRNYNTPVVCCRYKALLVHSSRRSFVTVYPPYSIPQRKSRMCTVTLSDQMSGALPFNKHPQMVYGLCHTLV